MRTAYLDERQAYSRLVQSLEIFYSSWFSLGSGIDFASKLPKKFLRVFFWCLPACAYSRPISSDVWGVYFVLRCSIRCDDVFQCVPQGSVIRLRFSHDVICS